MQKLLTRLRTRWTITLLVVVAGLLPCIIPLVEGRAWNGIGPMPFLPLNPPENYAGPIPESQITAESWGASSVVIPFQVRLRHYLVAHELPLWNPYQGLGQQFAAQGEGCPYSPLAIIRALLPYRLSNLLTLAYMCLAALCFDAFLRNLGVTVEAARVGSLGYILSGALMLQLARPNLAEQLCTIPLLFWTAELAIRRPSAKHCVLFSLAAAMHALGGFIQIAMLSAVLCVVFSIFYGLQGSRPRREKSAVILTALICFVLGNGLAGPFLIPLAEAMHSTFNKNVEQLAFIPMPYANILSFFSPYIFGPYFKSWIPGSYPQVVDWDNLFAFAAPTSALLVLAALPQSQAWLHQGRRQFAFFASATVLLLLRYISFPPVGILNLLPIIGRQSPKHANGITVFVLAAAAAFAFDALRRGWTRRGHLFVGLATLATLSCVFTLVQRQGGWAAANSAVGMQALALTLGSVFALWWLLAAQTASVRSGTLVFAMVGECALFLPLGDKTMEFIWGRCCVFLLLLLGGWCWGKARTGSAIVFASTALLFYTAFIIPRSHLPLNADLTQPSSGLNWLAKSIKDSERAFGIPPEFSSTVGVRSIDVLGPLAPPAYFDFVSLVADDAALASYKASCVFALEGYYWRYPLSLYAHYAPIFDAAGVKYLVLDKQYYGPGKRNSDSSLTAGPKALKVAFEDERTKILMAPGSAPELRFSTGFEVRDTKQQILAEIHANPGLIAGRPLVERSPALTQSRQQGEAPYSISGEVRTANALSLVLRAPGAGILGTNDVFDPNWRVNVNGVERPLLRIDGIFRGVYVPTAGVSRVVFSYIPRSFVHGLWVAGICLGALLWIWFSLSRAIVPHAGEKTLRPFPLILSSFAAFATIAVLFTAYLGVGQ